jgi:hypothetical protein
MIKTAYVVTEGEYSDYSVVGVFLDKVLADKYVEAANGKSGWYFQVEEFPLDVPKINWTWTRVRMSKSGDVVETERKYPSLSDTAFWNGFDDYNNLMWCVNTEDVKRAVKVTNEKRVQFIVSEIWTDDYTESNKRYNKIHR